MTKNQLMAYLENVLALEGALQQHSEAANQINEVVQCLEQPVTIGKPYLPSAKKERLNGLLLTKYFTSLQDVGGNIFLDLFLGLSFPCVVLIIIGVVSEILGNPWQMAVKTTVIIAAAMLIGIDIIRFFVLINKNQKLIAENEKENLNRIECYDKALTMEEKRLKQESDQKNELAVISTDITNAFHNLQAQLDNLYQKNILHPDFRGFVTVTYLYKYLSAGITDKLEGPNGAYAQYLNDERTNRILRRLDDITAQLRQIAINQTRQLEMLSAMHHTFMDIHSSIDRLNIGVQNLAQQVHNLTTSQCEAATYLHSISGQLAQISSSVDTVALNAHVQALNNYRTSIEAGVNAYYMEYPA